jgi:hypothetical protein
MFGFGFDLFRRHDVIPAFAGMTPWYWLSQSEYRPIAFSPKAATPRPLASV